MRFRAFFKNMFKTIWIVKSWVLDIFKYLFWKKCVLSYRLEIADVSHLCSGFHRFHLMFSLNGMTRYPVEFRLSRPLLFVYGILVKAWNGAISRLGGAIVAGVWTPYWLLAGLNVGLLKVKVSQCWWPNTQHMLHAWLDAALAISKVQLV